MVLMMFCYMQYWWSRAESRRSREPRLVGFNTGPGPEPGIRGEAELKVVAAVLGL